MGKTHHEEHHDDMKNPEVNYEVRDTDIKSVYYVTFIFVVFAAIGPFLLYGFWWMFMAFVQKTDSTAPQTGRDTKEMRRLDTEPILQGVARPNTPEAKLNPDEDMGIWSDKEEAYLKSYGPAKHGNGAYRIPIEKAMEKMLEKGYPVKVATVGQPATGEGGSAAPPAPAATPAPAAPVAAPTTPTTPAGKPEEKKPEAAKPAAGH